MIEITDVNGQTFFIIVDRIEFIIRRSHSQEKLFLQMRSGKYVEVTFQDSEQATAVLRRIHAHIGEI